MGLPPPLRRYQLEPFAAILAAAARHDASTIVIRMSRQAGKNELSARAEGALLAGAASAGGQGVKAAPTQTPQAVRSLARLAAHLRACGFRRHLLSAGNDSVTLGRASWWFGSGEPGANVVGGTASLLLEFDEAQDFDIEKHDKDYRPMAASTAAATVYYGTAWSAFDLLETARLAALELEEHDGRKRVFDVRWDRVAAEVPAYGLFVETERRRLGHTALTPHPAFLTQYELVARAAAGRLLNAEQLRRLQGDHARQTDPQTASHNVYVAGLDVGGADLSGSGNPDETVLTIGRSRYPGRGQTSDPIVDVVQQLVWQGDPHEAVRADVQRELDRWRPAHTVVDATGIGEPLATALLARYGPRRVTAFKFSRASKSSLGHDFLAAVNTGALRLWQPDGPDHTALFAQLRNARAEPLPGSLLGWGVDAGQGHDDRLVSLVLLVRAASRGQPRVARQRQGT